jgi:transposase
MAACHRGGHHDRRHHLGSVHARSRPALERHHDQETWSLSKRLERGRFTWPAEQDGAVALSPAQLSLLFSGLDWSQVVPRTALLAQHPPA